MLMRAEGIQRNGVRPRILTFDIMRGIFMISIIINHLGAAFGFSIFVLLTGGYSTCISS